MDLFVSAAGAIINRKKEILIIKRSKTKKVFPNKWSFPAGGYDLKDCSLKKTAIREVEEEVGLKFIPKKKFNFYENKGNSLALSVVYLGNWSGNVILQKSECSDFGWFSYKKSIKLPLTHIAREVIVDLHKEGYLN